MRRCRQLVGTWTKGRAGRSGKWVSTCSPTVQLLALIPKHYGYQKISTSSPQHDERLMEPLRKNTAQLVNILLEKGDNNNADNGSSGNDRGHLSKHIVTSQDCRNILDAWLDFVKKTRNIQGAHKAKEFLHVLEQHTSEQGRSHPLAPTRLYYDIVLQAYGVCGRAQDAQDYLIEHVLCYTNTAAPTHSAKSFNIVLHAWAQQGGRRAGHQAEELMKWMKDNTNIKADCRTITAVVEAWANSSTSSGHTIKASERIQSLFQQALQDHQEGTLSLDIVTVNTVIRSLAKVQGDRQGAELCEQILHRIEDEAIKSLHPTTATYSMVLHAWAECEKREQQGDAAQRAETILRHMIRLYSKGSDIQPNTRNFTTCIAAWSRCSNNSDNGDSTPAPEHRAEALLDQLLLLYEETQHDVNFKPDTAAGNAVVIAWSRSSRPDAAEQTLRAIEKLKSFAEPDLRSYNSVLHVYSRTGDGKAALDLLKWLDGGQKQQEQKRPPPQPDLISYNSTLNALAKNKTIESAQVAEDLLYHLESRAAARPEFCPTSVSVTSVINAWFHSGEPSPFEHVSKLVRRFVGKNKMVPDPDYGFFVAVLQTLSKEEIEKQAALEFAKKIFVEVVRRRLDSELVYAVMLDVCNQLATSDDDNGDWSRLAKAVFQECRNSGRVSRRVLHALRARESAPASLLEEIIGVDADDSASLPAHWSSKVPRRHRP